MSPRSQYHALLWIVWPVLGMATGLLGALVSPWFFLLFVGVMVAVEVWTSLIKCPECHRAIGWGKYNVVGFEFNWWKIWIARHCPICGHDLSRGRLQVDRDHAL